MCVMVTVTVTHFSCVFFMAAVACRPLEGTSSPTITTHLLPAAAPCQESWEEGKEQWSVLFLCRSLVLHSQTILYPVPVTLNRRTCMVCLDGLPLWRQVGMAAKARQN